VTESVAPLRVHVISETARIAKETGVHTAFVDCVNLLRDSPDFEVIVNGEGWGDVLHSHTYGPYFLWKGLRYRGRRVFTAHVIPDSARGSFPLWRLLLPAIRWYLRGIYSYADVCVAVSPVVADSIRALGAKTEVIEIFSFVDEDRFHPSAELRAAGRKRLSVPEDAFVVLGVGTIEGRKGVEDFIDVAQACPEALFVWVGGRPFGAMTEGIARINRRIRRATENVRFAGLFDLEEMPLAYNAADLFLFPSLQENCPVAPLEAAACGLPVIYKDIPEYRQLYRLPYLKARDTAEFTALTRRMIQDRAYFEEGCRISRELLGQFSKGAVRAQLLDLYREVHALSARQTS